MWRNQKGFTGLELISWMFVFGLGLMAFGLALKATLKPGVVNGSGGMPPIQVQTTDLGWRTVFRAMLVDGANLAQIKVCREDVKTEGDCKPDDVLYVDATGVYTGHVGVRVYLIQVDPRTDLTMRFYVDVSKGYQLPASSPGPYM